MKIIRSMRLAAAFAVASLAGCSSASPSPSTGFGGSGSDQGTSSGTAESGSLASSGDTASSGDGTSGAGSTTGSQAPSGSGSAAASGSSSGSATGSSGTASSGTAAATDAGTVAPTRGCGQGTSCTPGDDLAPPASADGFQIATPPGTFTIQPNQEAYYCYYKNIPGSAAINVGAFQSWMTKGFSHHFILFQGSGADGTVSGGLVSGGIGTGCVPQGTWLYATSTSGQIIELKMPDQVGLPMPASQTLVFNIHLINAGTTAANPIIKLNVLYAKNVMYKASAMVSFNAGIDVPPGGSQDVTGSCSPPAGSKFFAYTTHVHKHGGSTATGAFTDVDYVSGGTTTNIVHSTDWENPDVGLWNAPNFLTVQTGDKFKYDCHFVNTGSAPVTFGETAATGEMCMSIGYYFPAGLATNGTSNPYCQ
jgi:hypothetical protein